MDAPGSWSAPRPVAPDEPEPQPQPEAVASEALRPTALAPRPGLAAAAEPEPQMQLAGWLSHKGGTKEGGSTVGSWRKGSRRNWKRRYFTQDGRNLCYYASSEDALLRKPPQARLDVALFELRDREPTPERPWAFVLSSQERDYQLSAGSAAEKSIWMESIRAAQQSSVAGLAEAGGPVLVSSSNIMLAGMADTRQASKQRADADVGSDGSSSDGEDSGPSSNANLGAAGGAVSYLGAAGNPGMETASHQGWLVKQGEHRKSWNRRWFVLSQHQFSYYRRKPGIDDEARCVFDLTNFSIEAGDPAHMSFAIRSSGSALVLRADDLVDMTRWIKELAKGIAIGKREREHADLVRSRAELEDEDVYVQRPQNAQLQKTGNVSMVLWSFMRGCVVLVGRTGLELIQPDSQDPGKATRPNLSVAVPQVGRGGSVITSCTNDDDIIVLGMSDGRVIGICVRDLEIVWVAQCSRSAILCLRIEVTTAPVSKLWCGAGNGSMILVELAETPTDPPRVAFSQAATPSRMGIEQAESSPVVDIVVSGGFVWSCTFGQVSVCAWNMNIEPRECVHTLHGVFRVTCLLARCSEIWVGQGDGSVLVFSDSSFEQLGSIVANGSEVKQVVAVDQRVWSMHANGIIRVLSANPPSLLASFPAHNCISSSGAAILVPVNGLQPRMWTASNVGSVRVWDASFPDTRHQLIDQKMKARKAEYTETRTLKVRVITYNVAEENPEDEGNQSLRDVWCGGPNDKGIVCDHKPFESEEVGAVRQWLDARKKTIENVDGVIAALQSSDMEPSMWLNDLSAMEQDGRLGPFVADVGKETSVQYDVIAIGLQEVEMTGKALAKGLVSHSDTAMGRAWNRSICFTLEREGYINVGDRQLVGLLCAVYVHRDHAPFLQDVSVNAVGCGLGGFAGNKGGISVKLKLYETELTFVNTHLAAHMNHVSKRNEDFESVAEALLPDLVINAANKAGAPLKLSTGSPLVWFGDLNYRIPLEFEEVIAAIDSADLPSIIAHDQLVVERDAQRVFVDFTESPIFFAPTYKFRPGTTDYDRREKKKSAAKGGGTKPPRVPAYCDRVLWAGPGIRPLLADLTDNHPLGYTSHLSVIASDHKPVSHSLLVDAQKVITARHEQVLDAVLKEVSVMETTTAPVIEIGTSTLAFGNIRFNDAKSQVLTIKNSGTAAAHFYIVHAARSGVAVSTSGAAAQFHFSEAAETSGTEIPPWVRFTPSSGQIVPGAELQIRVTAAVNRTTASGVPTSGTLDARIELRTYATPVFAAQAPLAISVKGTCIVSCWGQSFDQLRRRCFPLRSAHADTSALAPVGERGPGRKEDWETGTCLPEEIQCLIDKLHKTAKPTTPLFVESADSDEVDLLVELLETVGSVDGFQGTTLATGDCLLLLLDNMPEPVIPQDFHGPAFQAAATKDASAMQRLIGRLPQDAQMILRETVRLSQHMLAKSTSTAVSSTAVAEVLGPIFLRPASTSEPDAVEFMNQLLTDQELSSLWS